MNFLANVSCFHFCSNLCLLTILAMNQLLAAGRTGAYSSAGRTRTKHSRTDLWGHDFGPTISFGLRIIVARHPGYYPGPKAECEERPSFGRFQTTRPQSSASMTSNVQSAGLATAYVG